MLSHLLPGYPHVVRDVGEHRGFDKESLGAEPLPASVQGRAFLLAALDHLHDLLELTVVNLQKY